MDYRLTKEGKRYLEKGLPENNLVKLLREKGKMPISKASNVVDDFNVALNWAKKNKWVYIENGFIRATNDSSSYLEDSLESAAKNIEDEYTETLLKRGLVEEVRETAEVRASKLKGNWNSYSRSHKDRCMERCET